MNEKFIKIASSTYKVVDFFPEADPIKNKAKEKVLLITEELTFIFSKNLTDNYIDVGDALKIEQILANIDTLLNYLNIAKDQDWVDKINFLILQKEYATIKSELNILIDKYKFTEKIGDNRQNIKKTENIEDIELSERQKKILDLMKNNERTQVSDIIKILPNVTKRTIRRDIEELLSSGKVIRFGQFNQVFYKLSEDKMVGQDKKNDGTIFLS